MDTKQFLEKIKSDLEKIEKHLGKKNTTMKERLDVMQELGI